MLDHARSLAARVQERNRFPTQPATDLPRMRRNLGADAQRMGGSLTAGFFLLQIWALPVNVFPSLDETLRDPNSVEEIRMMFLACWEGLLRLHNAGYAHRDVRASNIMISSEEVVFIDLENSA
jgi:hypothetical protein